jgi:Tol biopolymer transport system component
MRFDGTDEVRVLPTAAQAAYSYVGSVAWSPDGKHIALIQYTPENLTNSTSLELTKWKSSRRQIILSDARLGSALYWLPDGRLLYGLRQDAWAVTLRSAKINGTPTRITRALGQISTITVSADGKLLAFVRESFQPHVYIATLSRDGRQLLTSRRLTLEESLNYPDTWTPDSKSVLFVSDRNGTTEIFKQSVDKALAESVVAGPGQKMDLPRLSPDGLEILFLAGQQKSPSFFESQRDSSAVGALYHRSLILFNRTDIPAWSAGLWKGCPLSAQNACFASQIQSGEGVGAAPVLA